MISHGSKILASQPIKLIASVKLHKGTITFTSGLFVMHSGNIYYTCLISWSFMDEAGGKKENGNE